MEDTILNVINSVFEQGAKEEIESRFLENVKNIRKWKCYTDYCLDDESKPNDVVSYTFIPHIHDTQELADLIKGLAAVDIKKTRKVHEDFVNFLKNYPLLNISFVLRNRKRLSLEMDDFKDVLSGTFNDLISQCDIWTKNTPKMKEYYEEIKIKKKSKCVVEHIKNDKKLKLIADMSLITMLGAYLSSLIIKKCDPTIFGWFSDRDAINEVCDGISGNLFHLNIWGLAEYKGKFAYSGATSVSVPYYEEFVRIPDYIAGTLADVNFEDLTFSKDKFLTVFTDYMGENNHNNFVFEVDFNKDGTGKHSCQRLKLNKVDTESK